MSTMQGNRRLDGTPCHELEPGEYALAIDGNRVWLCFPSGEFGQVDDKWTITIEDDATITVDPSIWVNKDGDPPGWHGFLQRGVWTGA